ncbi:NACHT domain-containing protein [Streptomonospora salina]
MRNRPWWRTTGFVAGALALGGVLALLGVFLRTHGLGTTANVAQLVAVALSVPSLAAGLVSWWRRPDTAVAPTAAETGEATLALAGLVERQWRDESLLRSLHDPAPMPVRWRLTSSADLMDRPDYALPAGIAGFAGSSDDAARLAERFLALPRRRLVVLGGPGTGKTTLAVQLLLELLASRAPEDPVPVLVPAAGWNTREQPDLHTWLAARVDQDYPALRALGPRTADRLVRNGGVLPVLDGLDEVHGHERTRVITALNRSLGTTPLILTSRKAEFAEAVAGADDVVAAAPAIVPERIAGADAAGYLEKSLRTASRRQQWQPVLNRLRTPAPQRGEEPLREITASPLGLWLLRAVYVDAHADPAPLLDTARFPAAADLRGHLLDGVIPAMAAARLPGADPDGSAPTSLPRREHDPSRIRAWLSFLAGILDRGSGGDASGGRDFAWWHLARRTLPRDLPLRIRLAVAAALTLVVGAAGFAVGATVFGIWGATAFGPAGAFGGGVVGGGLLAAAGVGLNLLGWHEFAQWSQEPPGYADLRLSGRRRSLVRHIGRSGFRAGVASFGASALVVGFAAWGGEGNGAGIGFGIAVAAAAATVGAPAAGVADGFIAWAETPALPGRVYTPVASFRADRKLNAVRGIPGGCALGLGIGLIVATAVEPVLAAAVGAASAYLFWLRFTFVYGRHHAWPAYLVASRYLAWKGLLPRRLMPFLDDAHRLGLLRAVGPTYQFRHAELQDHLAGRSGR